MAIGGIRVVFDLLLFSPISFYSLLRPELRYLRDGVASSATVEFELFLPVRFLIASAASEVSPWSPLFLHILSILNSN